MQSFFIRTLCVFETSKNGIRNNSKMLHEKKSCTAETGKLEETPFEMYRKNTVIGWLPDLKMIVLYSFLFQSVPLLFE